VSRSDEIVRLIDIIGYPPGDLRVGLGELALEIAAVIDAGVDERGLVHPPSWCLAYVLEDLTGAPNKPPNRLHEIRERFIRGTWAITKKVLDERNRNE